MSRRSRKSLNPRESFTLPQHSDVTVDSSFDAEQIGVLRNLSVAVRPSLLPSPDVEPLIPQDSNVSSAELRRKFPEDHDWYKRLDKTFRPSFTPRAQKKSLRRPIDEDSSEDSTVRSEQEASMQAPAVRKLFPKKKQLFSLSHKFDQVLKDTLIDNTFEAEEIPKNSSKVSVGSRRSNRLAQSTSALANLESPAMVMSPREKFRRWKSTELSQGREKLSEAIQGLQKSVVGATINKSGESPAAIRQSQVVKPSLTQRQPSPGRRDPPQEDSRRKSSSSEASPMVPVRSKPRETAKKSRYSIDAWDESSSSNKSVLVPVDQSTKTISLTSKKRAATIEEGESLMEQAAKRRNGRLFAKNSKDKKRFSSLFANIWTADDSERDVDVNKNLCGDSQHSMTEESPPLSARHKLFAKTNLKKRGSSVFDDVLNADISSDFAVEASDEQSVDSAVQMANELTLSSKKRLSDVSVVAESQLEDYSGSVKKEGVPNKVTPESTPVADEGKESSNFMAPENPRSSTREQLSVLSRPCGMIPRLNFGTVTSTPMADVSNMVLLTPVSSIENLSKRSSLDMNTDPSREQPSLGVAPAIRTHGQSSAVERPTKDKSRRSSRLQVQSERVGAMSEKDDNLPLTVQINLSSQKSKRMSFQSEQVFQNETQSWRKIMQPPENARSSDESEEDVNLPSSTAEGDLPSLNWKRMPEKRRRSSRKMEQPSQLTVAQTKDYTDVDYGTVVDVKRRRSGTQNEGTPKATPKATSKTQERQGSDSILKKNSIFEADSDSSSEAEQVAETIDAWDELDQSAKTTISSSSSKKRAATTEEGDSLMEQDAKRRNASSAVEGQDSSHKETKPKATNKSVAHGQFRYAENAVISTSISLHPTECLIGMSSKSVVKSSRAEAEAAPSRKVSIKPTNGSHNEDSSDQAPVNSSNRQESPPTYVSTTRSLERKSCQMKDPPELARLKNSVIPKRVLCSDIRSFFKQSTPLKEDESGEIVPLDATNLSSIKKLIEFSRGDRLSLREDPLTPLQEYKEACEVTNEEDDPPAPRNLKLEEFFKEVDELVPPRMTAEAVPPLQPTRVFKKGAKSPQQAARNKLQFLLPDGKVYKQPKLLKPKKFVTDKMYRFITKNIKDNTNVDTRIRAEAFVGRLCDTYNKVLRRKKTKDLIDELLEDMVRLGLVSTYSEFYRFVENFMPFSFRMKAIPCINSDLAPKPKKGIHEKLEFD